MRKNKEYEKKENERKIETCRKKEGKILRKKNIDRWRQIKENRRNNIQTCKREEEKVKICKRKEKKKKKIKEKKGKKR